MYQWGVKSTVENNFLFFRNLSQNEINGHSACQNTTLLDNDTTLLHNWTYYSTFSVFNGAEISLVTTNFSNGGKYEC